MSKQNNIIMFGCVVYDTCLTEFSSLLVDLDPFEVIFNILTIVVGIFKFFVWRINWHK